MDWKTMLSYISGSVDEETKSCRHGAGRPETNQVRCARMNKWKAQDYAKNLGELVEIRSGSLSDDEFVNELKEIRRGVEDAFQATLDIFATSDSERAMHYIHQSRDLAHRCESLIRRVATSSHDAAMAVVLVLCSRYYKRIGGHALNILSAVVMPLHKVDYYDEDEIPKKQQEAASTS